MKTSKTSLILRNVKNSRQINVGSQKNNKENIRATMPNRNISQIALKSNRISKKKKGNFKNGKQWSFHGFKRHD